MGRSQSSRFRGLPALALASLGVVVMAGGCLEFEMSGSPSRPRYSPPSPAYTAPPPLPVRVIPAMKVRLPPDVDMAEHVEFEGRDMTVREFSERVPTDRPVRLRSGKIVTVQQVLDAVDHLEGRAGVRLQQIPRVQAPLPQSEAAVRQSAQNLEVPGQRFKIVQHARWQRVVGVQEDRLRARRAAYAPVRSSPPSGHPTPAVKSGQANEDPTQFIWERHWGSAEFGGQVSVFAGSSFHEHATEIAGIVCGGGIEAHADAFGRELPLARFEVSAGAAKDGVDAWAALFLLGQATPVWTKGNPFKSEQLQRTFSTPEFSTTIPIYGPLAVRLVGVGTGTIGVRAEASPSLANGRAVCTGAMGPFVRATGTVRAEPAITGLPDFVRELVNVGVRGDLHFVEIETPASLALTLFFDPKARAVRLGETIGLNLKGNFLQGSIVAYVDIDLPSWATKIKKLRNYDGHHERVLYTYPGVPLNKELVKPLPHEIQIALR